jgi:pimeloyl-ACP methyl ester carboxylesterase
MYMRRNVLSASSAAAFLSVALVAGCGDNDSPAPDAAPPDAPAAPDAGAPDAGAPDAGLPVDYPKQTVTLSTGIDMQYVEVGDPAGADTVIMLHGYTDTSRSYFPTIEALTALDPDLHIYALDLRGHGGSSMPDAAACAGDPRACFGLDDFADDVFAFMDARDITTVHLVGHSMGAMLAHEIALTIPGSVESLVLIGAAASTVANPLLQDFILDGTIQGNVEGRWQFALEANPSFGDWPQDAYNLTPLDADPNAEEWMATNWVVDPVANQDFLAAIVPETARVRIGTWLGAAEAMLETDNTARLAALAVDSLIIWATQDLIFFEAEQVALRTALDPAAAACQSGYHWKKYGKAPPPATGINDLSHNTHRAAPAQVAADIHAFITTGAPTPDLYFANPNNPGEILTEIGAAEIIEKPAATGCAR